jgi:hypothetical protein
MRATPPVALVTGASFGIGKAAALALSDANMVRAETPLPVYPHRPCVFEES